MSGPIYIDVTELASNPIRTGIQRVVRQLFHHWPIDNQLIPCVFDKKRGALIALPVEAQSLLLDASEKVRRQSSSDIAAAIGRAIASHPGAPLPLDEAKFFIPEVFFERLRANFYTWLCSHACERVYVLAYDFIPYLEPEKIGVVRGGNLMYYLRVMQAVRKIGFISAKTRDDYTNRIVRDARRSGPVFTLGSDAWTAGRQQFEASRRTFVCLGSIDGRKNQNLILRAFRRLWETGMDVDLVMVGGFFDPNSAIAQEISAAKDEPRFQHLTSITDEEIAALMRRARATLYISSVEGYGLPPVESLASGVPVIAAASVPSFAALAPVGHIRLHDTSPASIAEAVARMMDDTEASRLWLEAASLTLPSWMQTAREIAASIQA